MIQVRVECANLECRHIGYLTFDELGMPDDLPFIHIQRSRRFRCLKCGRRRVEVDADWRPVRAHGAGRPI